MNKSGVKWVVLGTAFGVIVGLLFAKKSGEDTRKDIMKLAGKAQEQTIKGYNVAREKVSKKSKVEGKNKSYSDKQVAEAVKKAFAELNK